MHIGIDARLIVQTGVGRYIRNMLSGLAKVDTADSYTVFLRSDDISAITLPDTRFTAVPLDVRWHTLREQLTAPSIFTRAGLDLLHVPYFNAPVLYRGATVLTIHDLTYLHFASGQASTLPVPLYRMKLNAYRIVVGRGIRNACRIIAVSQATRNDIVREFPDAAGKITVIYEGVDAAFSRPGKRSSKVAAAAGRPYLLYVGNAYPHKNLERLIDAFALLTADGGGTGPRLVLVGPEDYFYRRLRRLAQQSHLSDRIVFFGPGTDSDLSYLYAHAVAGVFPSLAEGFGLPPLEALSAGCPVFCSDIPVFRELLTPYVTYFRADDVPSIQHALAAAIRDGGKHRIRLPQAFLSRFSWDRMARQTHDVYETCGGRA